MTFKRNIILVLIVIFTSFTVIPVFANPSFDHTENGDIRVDEQGSTYNIYSSDRAVGAFNSFSNQAGETINSIQANANHSVLFRVTGTDPSVFFGNLNANSHVFLINPNGIVFGAGSQVNAAGLVASTLDIANSDFLSNHYVFAKDPTKSNGYILNEGNLKAADGGYVVLLAGAVNNQGNIQANNGSVTLTAAEKATLSLDTDGLVSVAVDHGLQSSVYDTQGNKINDAINNGGTIQADGGHVILSSQAQKELFDSVINHTGMIEARSVSTKNGEIILDGGNEGIVKVTGSLDASGQNIGEKGGTVEVLGSRIALLGNASIDVSGDQGGGMVLIGGDYQGKGIVPNAEFTEVGTGVSIKANALTYGNGGKVITWADDSTWFFGNVDARGGAHGGNGGFTEISGKQGLVFDGMVDSRAPQGLIGTLLFDPTDITIHDAVDGVQGNNGALPDLSNGTVGAGAFNIGELALEALAAASAVNLQATNNITINSLATDHTLSLAVTNLGSLTMTADSDSSGVGAFTMNTADTIRTLGGGVTISGASATIGSINTTPLVVLAGGNINVTTSGNLTVSGSLTAQGGTAVGVGLGGGNVTLSGGTVTTSAINTSGSNAAGIALANGGNAGTIGLTATGGTPTITLNGNLTATGGTGIIGGTQGNGGAITLNNNAVLGTTVTLNSTGSTNGAISSVGNITGNQTLNITAGTATISLHGVDVDTLNFNSGGVLTLNGAVETDTNLSFANVGTVTLGGDTTITAQDSDSANAAKNITFNVGNTISGNHALTLQGDTVTLSGVNLTAGALSVTGDEVELGGGANSIISTGAIVIQPLTVAKNIEIAGAGGTGAFDLTAVEIANLKDGFSSITIGRSDGTGAVTVNAVTFTDPITIRSPGLAGSITTNGAISTSAANAAITFTAGTGNSGTFTQSAASTIASGSGAITITADTAVLDTTANSITGTGAITIQPSTVSRPLVIGAAGAATDLALTSSEIGALTNGFSSITIGRSDGTGGATISAITFNDPVSILSPAGGSIAVNGQITGAGNASVLLNGFNATTLAANIVTAGTTITLSDNVTLGANGTLDATNSGGSAAGADILISGTIDADVAASNRTLTLTAGTGGDVTITGAIGSSAAVGTLTISSADDVTLQTVNTRDGGISVTTAGASPTITLNGNLSTDVGTNAGAISLTGPITLGADITLDTDSASGTDANVSFATSSSTVNGAHTLTIGSGTGDITLAGALGSSVVLSGLTLSGNDISLANIGGGAAGVSGATSVTATTNGGDTGSITFTGATYNANAQTYTAPSGNNFALNAGAATTFTATDDAINFATGTLLLANGSDLTITSGGGTITLNGGIRGNSSEDIALTSSGGSTNTISIGAIGSSDEINTVALTASSGITLNGDITTSDLAGNTVTLTGPVTLGTDVTINTDKTTNDGNISLTSTINGGHALTLASGTADITLSGALGATTPLTGLTITGNDITLANIGGGSAGVSGTTSVTATTNGGDTGSITFSGTTYNANAQTYTAPSGNNFALNGAAATTFTSTDDAINFATGTLLLANGSDLTVTSAGGAISINGGIRGNSSEDLTLSSSGGTTNTISVGAIGTADEINTVAITAPSGITLNGNITTSNAAGNTVTLTGPVTLGSTVTVTTDTAGTDGDISFSSTINGTQALTLTSGTADITLSGALGATTPLSSLTISGNDITLANIGGGSAGVSGATAVTAATNGGDTGSITFNGTIYNANAQTYTAPSGSNFALNAGLSTAFTSTDDAINFATGTLLLANGSDLTITSGGGVISLNGGIRGNSSEDVTLTSSGGSTNTISVGAIGTSDEINTVSITAPSGITLNGNVTTSDLTGNTVTLTGPVTLGADVTVTTDKTTNDGNISFSSTINGAHALTLSSGSADITLSGAVGAVTPLSSLTINGNDITLANIGAGAAGVSGATAVTATTTGGDTGSITFTGTTYNANAQIYTAPSGNNFAINGGAATTFTSTDDAINFATGTLLLANGSDLTVTSGGGAISINGGIRGNSSEDLTLTSSGGSTNTISIGAIGSSDEINTVALTASSSITLNGDITTSDAAGNTVALTGPVTLGADVSVNTNRTTNDGTINFSSTINGAHALTLDSGTVDITLAGAIGGLTPLTSLTINNAANVSFGSTVATSGALTQTDGSGTTTFSGAVTTGGNVVIANDVINFNGTGSINANSGAANITLTAQTGAITDNTGAETANVTGNTVTLTAATGIGAAGAAGDIDTAATALNLSVTSAGLININEADAVTFNSILTVNGGITITTGGATTIGDIQADTGVSGSHDISITNTSGDMTVGTITSDHDISLTTSAGAILDSNGSAINLTAGNAITLTASGNIGAPTDPIEIDHSVITLTATSSGGTVNTLIVTPGVLNQSLPSGDITSSTTSNITISNASTPTGSVTVTTTGSILSISNTTVISAGNGINLSAGGTVGTATAPVIFSSSGSVSINAQGQTDGVSVNLQGNTSRADLNFSNLPPGLVIYNHAILGGGLMNSLMASTSSTNQEVPHIYRDYGIQDKDYKDFPGLQNQDNFAHPIPLDLDQKLLTTVLDASSIAF